MQVATVGLLSVVWAAGMGLVAGCDNITAGQTTDSSAPPQLLHVLIQDASSLSAFPNRASVVDLIDYYSPPACHIYGKDAKGNQIDDCLTQFEIDGQFPDFSCQPSGVCGDPIRPTSGGVPIAASAQQFGGADPMTDPGGGQQIRLVFDKVLDNSIEDVKGTGAMRTYTLHSGIVELDGPSGPVDSIMFLDNAGSPLFSSDLELIPLGPAIVIKPTVTLDVGTTYTVKILNPSVIKDREGNLAVGAGNSALQTTWKFTTESDLQEAAGANAANLPFGGAGFQGTTDKTTMATTLAPNEVITIPFYGRVKGDSATLMVVKAPPGAHPVAFSERGTDPTMCSKTMDPLPSQLVIANGDTSSIVTAKPTDWPAGDYDITFTVTDATGKSTVNDELKFTVTGMDADPTTDTNTYYTAMAMTGHVFPAQCSM